MGDYEPITKGLRDEMAHGSAGNADVVVLEKTDFEAFCDNIDAIHRSLEAENERLRNASERGDDWIKLPVDADGVPIRVGDVMENIVCPPVHREVTGVGAECFYGWDEGNGRYSQFGANCYRHHHAPTVEDVLREFAYGLGVPVADSYVAAAASKLRLAGDAE